MGAASHYDATAGKGDVKFLQFLFLLCRISIYFTFQTLFIPCSLRDTQVEKTLQFNYSIRQNEGHTTDFWPLSGFPYIFKIGVFCKIWYNIIWTLRQLLPLALWPFIMRSIVTVPSSTEKTSSKFSYRIRFLSLDRLEDV